MTYKRICLITIIILSLALIFMSVVLYESRYKSGVKTESIEESKIELIEKRLDGMEKTMHNLTDEVMKWRIQEKCQTVGCNCRFVKECTAVSCVKYDERGRCVRQVCVAWETRFVCD